MNDNSEDNSILLTYCPREREREREEELEVVVPTLEVRTIGTYVGINHLNKPQLCIVLRSTHII